MGTLRRVPYTLEVTHRNPGTAMRITGLLACTLIVSCLSCCVSDEARRLSPHSPDENILEGTWLCTDLMNMQHIAHFKGMEITFNRAGEVCGYLISHDGERFLKTCERYDAKRRVIFAGNGVILCELENNVLTLVYPEGPHIEPREERTLIFVRKEKNR